MKKNITCLILSLLFTFTFLGQNSQEKRNSFIHRFNNIAFNKINNGDRISYFKVNNKQKSSIKYKADKKKKLDSTISIGADGYDHRSTFIYNNNGYLIISTKSDRENSNQWIIYSKDEYTYDNQGNVTSIVDKNWNSNTNNWDFYSKDEYTYNSEENTTSIVFYNWDQNNNEWVYFEKIEFTYDTQGNTTSTFFYNWNQNINQWDVHRTKKEYVYNTEGNLTSTANYHWNQNENQWVNSGKIEFIYNTKGNVASIEEYDWNSNSNNWNFSDKEEYTYDNEGNIILQIRYYWSNNQWVNIYKGEYNYDTNYNSAELILPPEVNYWFHDDIESNIKNMMTNFISFEYSSQIWAKSSESTMYYSDVSTSNNICENLSITNATYPETDDLNQKVKDEFGVSFTIADWNDIKNMTNLDDWVSCMGLKHDDAFMVTRNGNFIYSGNRQYYVHYSTDGVPYSGFAVHDQIGDFYLGSWYGLNMKILAKGESTHIADSNFEKALIDLGIVTDGNIDGIVQTSDISLITTLDISSSNISDLTGIEDFTSLDTLIVSNNQLISLDLTNNSNLTFLDVSNNPLTTIILTNDTSAKPSGSKFSQQTMFAPNTNLLEIDIHDTYLVEMDLSNIPNLEYLKAQGSQLSSLDVSNNSNLSILNITNTPLTCIQVSQTQLNNIPSGWQKDTAATYNTDCQSQLGVDDELLAKSINIYPNPVTDLLTIDSKLSLTKIEIYSILGKRIKVIDTNFNAIPTYDLSSGMYLVRIESEKGYAVKKLFKQ